MASFTCVMDGTSNALTSHQKQSHSPSSESAVAEWFLITTSVGTFSARFSERGLAAINFPESDIRGQRLDEAPAELQPWLNMTATALNAAVEGRAATDLPPFDWTHATEFQKLVWSALCRIPSGATETYGSIAREVGTPGAARAVGAACGANPIPVLVPCHRVLAARGAIGGFSGGLDWKRRLLAIEAHAGRFQLRG